MIINLCNIYVWINTNIFKKQYSQVQYVSIDLFENKTKYERMCIFVFFFK